MELLARSPIAKIIWLPIHQRNFGSHMTVRPLACLPAIPSIPQGNQYKMLHSLASVGACILILQIHVVFSSELSNKDHVTILRTLVLTH